MITGRLYPVRLLTLLLAGCLAWQPVCAGIVPSRDDIVFLVDNSSAMQPVDKHIDLPAAISTFIARISRDVRVALILFDDSVTLATPLTPVGDGQTQPLLDALEDVDYDKRFSNSAAAVERALYELEHNGRQGAGKSIVLISRGDIHTGNEALDLNFSRWVTDVLAEDAAAARIRVYCIAFTDAAEIPIMQTLASNSGGHLYRFTGDTGLSSLLDRLAADIFSRPLTPVSD